MNRFSTALFPILLACLFGQVQAGQPGAGGEPDAPPDEGNTGKTDTDLGPFSIGVTNVNENERLKTISGDIELGYLYEHEFDSTFPRVLELRPFLFNRAGTTETAYYESLGIGAGLGLSLRKKYEENNWFIRLSMLTPNDRYRAQYDLDRDQTTIVDLFAGYEIPIGVTDRGRELRERTAQPGLIELRVPVGMLGSDQKMDQETLARVHALMIDAYLAEAARLQGLPPRAPRRPRSRWPVIDLIEDLTGQRLNKVQRQELADGAATGELRTSAARRRQIVGPFVKRGLTQMMRESYVLFIKPISGSSRDSNSAEGSGQVVGFVSRPGMRSTTDGRTMDADVMIDHYVAALRSRID